MGRGWLTPTFFYKLSALIQAIFFLQETDIDGFSWHPTFKSIAEKWRYNVQDPAAVLELDKLMEEWFIFISSNFITHF